MYNLREILLAGLLASVVAWPVRAESLPDMATALTAAASKNWPAAEAAAAKSGPLAQALVDWQALRAGRGDFAAYLAFARAHPDWPGMELLYKRGEGTLTAATPAADVIEWFAGHDPQTGAGARLLIAALKTAKPEAAEQKAQAIWTSLPMTGPEEIAFLTTAGDLVDAMSDARVFALLDRSEWQAAQQGLTRMSAAARPLAEARIATQSRRSGADALILALPEAQRGDAGLAMDRFRWRVQAKMPDLARELMLERSTSAEALRMPEAWADLRADYARAALRDGDWKTAETLAAAHFLEPGSEAFADLEFLAGYAALRGGAPDRALTHFKHLADNTKGIVSQARAHYWQGRALEAAAQPEAAKAAFAAGAKLQSTYYGQLAAERIGAAPDPALSIPGRSESALPQWRRDPLRENAVFQAGVFAFAAGQPDLGQRFFLHLSETATPEDIARMARLTLEMRYPWHALRLAKRAAARGAVYPAAYFPLTGLEGEALEVPAELVMSIARQESEFNHQATSHVGALGLMQVMPATAQQMAQQVGMDYSRARMTDDALYNARLGAAYLQGLRNRFGPSSALVAAGYNAGPGRSRQWTEAFGDIRTETDPVDWVEMIPFDETRNYVMRVTEALPIYRARIAGQPVAVTPSKDLTGGGIVPPPPKARQTLAEVLTQSRRPPREGDPLSPRAAAFREPEIVPAPTPARPTPRPGANAGVISAGG
ncbi:lytic transglycosylase domain-containing protein [Paracoccus sp. S1E-3]|nr:lytic transglycosylase domain-containing protein [Paracoccus sp. S1E-3]